MVRDMGLLQILAELGRREDDLKEVIARAERDLAKIQYAKEINVEIAEAAGISRAELPSAASASEDAEEEPKEGGPYSGMTTPDAALAFLREARGPQKTAQIAKGVLRGGIVTEAKDFPAAMFGTLRRMVKDGRVVKAGTGLWALPNQAPRVAEGTQQDLRWGGVS